MAEKNKVMIKIEADIKQLQSSMKEVEKSLKGIEGSTSAFDGLKGAIGGIGGAVASAFAVDRIVDFTSQAVQSASELSSLNAQYEQVLGTMKGQADKYLDGISQKYNQHPNELKKSFTMYQAMLKGKGVSEKEAFELAKMYIERTADASAFGNMSMAQSTEYFMAMIKGEYDSLDNAMVFTSQTMMNDEAQKVYGKKWEDLTVTQQEYLKTSVAIKQHTDSGVLGQGIRESQEFGVVTQNLKATWNDLMASFGHPIMEALAPKLQEIAESLDTEKVKEMATQFGEFAVKVINSIPPLLQLASQFAPLISGILGTVGAMKTMQTGQKVLDGLKTKATGVKTAFNLLKNNTNGLKGAFTVLQGVLKAPLFNPVTLGIGIAIGLAVLLIQNWDKVKEACSLLGEKITEVFSNMGEFLGEALNSMVESIANFCINLGSAISTGLSEMAQWFSECFNSAKEVVANIFTTIGTIISTILSAIVNVIVSYLQTVVTFWSNVFNTIRNVVSTIFNIVATIISTVLSTIVSIVVSTLQSIYSFWSNVFNTIRNIVTTIFNAIRNIISTVLSTISSIVRTVWNAISNTIKTVLSTISSIISTVWNAIRNTISTVSNSIKSVISTVWNGIKSVVSTVSNTIKSTISTVWNGIKSVISSVGSAIKNTVGKVFGDVLGKVKSNMDKASNTVKTIFNKIKGIFNQVLKPNIKMPHFEISGKFSLNPLSVPKFGISWYQTGGIFTGASVVGVGENGDEAVVPLSNKRRMKPFASAVASMIDTNNRGASEGDSTVNINISQMIIREEADIKKVAEELNKLSKRDNRKKGLV